MFFDYTLLTVIMGTTILGVTSGALGVFALLRQQSLLGDAISHAALPGIATMFLCTQSKNPAILMLGGAIAGIIGTCFVSLVTHKTSLKKDAALGMVLSIFFGLGLVLLTIIQKRMIPHQAILNKFLFGNASTLIRQDVYIMGIISLLVFVILGIFWKEFKVLSFDKAYAHTLGYPILVLEVVMTLLLVLSIVIGLQTVGVVLMSTMLIAPAAAARQWVTRLETMVVLAACIGGSSGVFGALVSNMIDQLPTGPSIVVVVSVMVIISLVFSPQRGVLVPRLRRQKNSF